MKIPVKKLDEESVRHDYPIADRVPGWFFRMTEQSNCVWCVEGTDLWGRKVGDVGSDENRVLASCIAMATKINKQLGAPSDGIPPVGLGATRNELRRLLGEPTDMSLPRRRQRQPAIWKYGDVEYHFGKDGRIWLIYREDAAGNPQVLGKLTQ